MTTYRVDSVKVTGLWGYKDFDLNFDPHVNIIIGPNASGKTTLLKLLHAVFSLDFRALGEVKFSHIRISLRSFVGNSKRTVEINTTEAGFTGTVGQRKFQFDLERFGQRRGSRRNRAGSTIERIRTSEGYIVERVLRDDQSQLDETLQELQDLVPTVWLPVSRRLPLPEEDYPNLSQRERANRADSVDQRLRELSEELTKYRLRLDAKISDKYKQFQKRVLGIILYSPEEDQPEGLPQQPFSANEKNLLLQAFSEAGLLDNTIRKRIERHFDAAERAVRAWSRRPRGVDSREIQNLAILPLIPRTRDMIEAAQTLEKERDEIFAPLDTYRQIVSSFLQDKSLNVLDNGVVEIRSIANTAKESRRLPIRLLSSGEKQILILLTQALLEHENPVVYLADEPELSLHISWQENLLQSLDTLGGDTQIIVATHSPDVVGPFSDKVIDLADKSS